MRVIARLSFNFMPFRMLKFTEAYSLLLPPPKRNWVHWQVRDLPCSTYAKYPEKLTFTYAYHGLRNVNFSEDFAYLLNEWLLKSFLWPNLSNFTRERFWSLFFWSTVCFLKYADYYCYTGILDFFLDYNWFVSTYVFSQKVSLCSKV